MLGDGSLRTVLAPGPTSRLRDCPALAGDSVRMHRMERMALGLFAAWTDLQTLMKDYTLIALDGDEATDYAEKGKYADNFILDEYKRIVRNIHGVAFPQVFSDFYNGAKAVRDKLAHMIDIESITGDQPNRIMTIVRSKGFEKVRASRWNLASEAV
jgi:hypothetical protein